MPQLFTNNARALLASGITDTATSLTVEAVNADRFPTANTGTGSVPAATDWFKITLQDASGNVEIVYVRTRTAGSGVMSNLLRGQEGTTARAFSAGTVVGLRITATDVEGSIAAAANSVQLTGNQAVGGIKRFTSNISIGPNVPATSFDIQTTGVNVLTTTWTTGIDDLNFRLGAMNGNAGSTGTSQGRVGLFYMGQGEAATIDFRRGAGALDGSIAFRTNGNDRATLDNAGNFSANGNVTANGFLGIAGTRLFQSNSGIGFEMGPGAGTGNTNIQGFFVGAGKSFYWGTNAGASNMLLDGSGNLTASGNVTAFSDIRLKTDLRKIPEALAKVKALTGYTYTRTDSGERQTGLVAQDVQRVLPEAVLEGEHLSVAYGNMVGLLVEAIKELEVRVKELEGR